LPDNWLEITLGELGEVITGNTPPTSRSELYGGLIPFIKPPHLNDRPVGQTEQSISDKGRAKARVIPANTVLVSCIGILGKTGISVAESAFNQQINAVVFGERVDPKFGFYQCQTLRPYLESVASATTVSIVNKSKFSRAPFRVAPMREQQRIVAKIEELFSDLDAGVAALKRAQANIKRYRAAVLKAAVEGKLTEQWRAENPPSEPASVLLERILAERWKKWEEEQLKKYEAKGKKPPKNWRERYKGAASPNTQGLPTLPDGWCWASAEQVASSAKYSLAIGPFGSDLKVSDYREEGVPLVFVRNIRSGVFDDQHNKFVASRKALELDAHSVEPGDVLITKMGDPPGDACIYPSHRPKAIITADCIKMRVSEALPSPAFIATVINSPRVGVQIVSKTRGVAQQKVSLARFRSIALPLPPAEEQEQIQRLVDGAMSVLAVLDNDVDRAVRASARLHQAILRRAFEGALIDSESRSSGPRTDIAKGSNETELSLVNE
jgi:type I restriction enzyme S subunit